LLSGGLASSELASAGLANPGVVSVPPIVVSTLAAETTKHGVTLKLQAGQSFTGSLGSLRGVGKKLEAHLTISASINWGDGTAADGGVVTIATNGVISVSGTHTYADAGKFAIVVTVTGAPIATGGLPTPDFILLIGRIRSRAIVSSGNSSTGVTLYESAGAAFTGSVGTFTTIGPVGSLGGQFNLDAQINWGDGSTSSGTLKVVPVIHPLGISPLITFEVDGTHSYAAGGTFGIVVTVTQLYPPTTLARLVATIDSTAIVSGSELDLDGTITGTYLLAPVASDIGATYVFNGTGTAGELGPVAAHGIVTLPGFITTDSATGTLTLTSASATAEAGGSVTLTLTGPTEAGLGSLPSTLNFVITSGTGRFAGASGSGTIAVTLGGTATDAFTFVLTSLLVPSV
jgi:hypothetical protein